MFAPRRRSFACTAFPSTPFPAPAKARCCRSCPQSGAGARHGSGTRSGSPLLAAELRQLEGAVERVPDELGELPKLDGVRVVRCEDRGGAGARRRRRRSLAALVERSFAVDRGSYLNLVERPTDTRTAVPADTYERLRGIRGQVGREWPVPGQPRDFVDRGSEARRGPGILRIVERVLGRAVFSVGDRSYTWGDIADAAAARGDWDAVSQRARIGLACAQRAECDERAVDAGEVERAGNAFRRERNLLAAEEMEAWLAGWGLDVALWLEWIRRAVLRDRWSWELQAEPEAAVPAWEDEWVEAVCSGVLEQFGVALAERVAALERYEGEAAEAGETAAMQAALDRMCAEAVTPAALQREVAAHWLEWTRVDCQCVVAPEQDVAKELVFCVHEDGRDLAGVAADAGLQVYERSWYVGDVATIAEKLLGAQPGELVGPLPVEGGLLLCLVAARATPDIADPLIRQRAASQIARRAVQREVATRVRWHVAKQPSNPRQAGL